MTTNIPTAGYVRVSTQAQVDKGASLDVQQQAIERRCAEEGWDYVGTYIEEAESGGLESRPQLDRLMADIEAGRIKRVVIYKIDRLERGLRHQLNRLYFFERHGVELAVTNELYDPSTPGGEMMAQMLGAIAEHERKMIRSRFEEHQDAAARAGKWPAGAPPYGYRTVPSPDGRGKVAEIDPAKAAVARRIVDEYLAGSSTKEIADGLQADGIPTPRKGQWDRNKVRVLLAKCEDWAGAWTFGRAGGPITIPMPRILDDDTVESVLAALKSRAFVRGPAQTYPLSMRVTTPCGSHSIAHGNRSAVRQYICADRRRWGPGHCDCVFVPAEPIEEAAFIAVSRFLRDRSAIERLIQHRVDRLVAVTGRGSSNLEALDQRIAEVETRLGAEAAEMRAAGFTPAAIVAALKPLSAELEAAEEMRESALKLRHRSNRKSPTAKALRAWIADDYSEWDGATLEERREMFSRLNVRVVITGWTGCVECAGRGKVLDTEMIQLDGGRNYRRRLGCPTCGGSGRLPHIDVSGSVPAELMDHVGAMVELAVHPGPDLPFTVGSHAVA